MYPAIRIHVQSIVIRLCDRKGHLSRLVYDNCHGRGGWALTVPSNKELGEFKAGAVEKFHW